MTPWLLATERIVLRVISIIVIGKINYEGGWLNCFFIQASLLRNRGVKKVLTFVTANMQPHCTLIEVSRKDPSDFFCLFCF